MVNEGLTKNSNLKFFELKRHHCGIEVAVRIRLNDDLLINVGTSVRQPFQSGTKPCTTGKNLEVTLTVCRMSDLGYCLPGLPEPWVLVASSQYCSS